MLGVLRSTRRPFQPISREGALILNNLLLCTLAPPCCWARSTRSSSTCSPATRSRSGPPFFNATFVRLRAAVRRALRRTFPRLEARRALAGPAAAVVVSLIAAIVAATVVDGRARLASLGFGIGLADRGQPGRVRRPPAPGPHVLRQLRRLKATPRSSLGMTIAHAALGFVVLGAVATSAWHLELMHAMKPGETVSFAGYTGTLLSVARGQGRQLHGRARHACRRL